MEPARSVVRVYGTARAKKTVKKQRKYHSVSKLHTARTTENDFILFNLGYLARKVDSKDILRRAFLLYMSKEASARGQTSTC